MSPAAEQDLNQTLAECVADDLTSLLAEDFEADQHIPTEAELSEVAAIADRMVSLDKKIVDAEASIKDAKERLRKIQQEELPAAMKRIGMASFKLSNGGEIEVKKIYTGNITKANQAAAYAWLRDQGHGDLIKNELKVPVKRGGDDDAQRLVEFLQESGLPYERKEFVAWQTLNAFVKEQMEGGKPLDMTLLGVYTPDVAQVKKAKKK